MITRSIDSNNDWNFGKGKSDYLSGVNAVAQNLQTRLQCFLGDCFFDLTAGIDWWNLLGSKRELDLRLAIASIILNTEDVNGLIELTPVKNDLRNVTFQYTVTTVYGNMTDTTTVEVA